MAASDEHNPDEPLAPLPTWQLFASVASQSELLDEVAQAASVGEGVAAVEQTTASLSVDSVWLGFGSVSVVSLPVESVSAASVAVEAAPAQGSAAAKATAPSSAGSSEDGPTLGPALGPVVRPITTPLVELGRPIRRSIFLRPLPTLADVEPGVEPALRTISPVGSEYQPGALSRSISGR